MDGMLGVRTTIDVASVLIAKADWLEQDLLARLTALQRQIAERQYQERRTRRCMLLAGAGACALAAGAVVIAVA